MLHKKVFYLILNFAFLRIFNAFQVHENVKFIYYKKCKNYILQID